MCGGAAPDNNVHLARVEVELLLRIVLQDALSEATKIYPLLKLTVFDGDVTALLMGKIKEVAEIAKKVMRKSKEVMRKGLEIVSHGKWEGRKEQDDSAMWFLGG